MSTASVHQLPIRLSNGATFTPTAEQIAEAQRRFGPGIPRFNNGNSAAQRETAAKAASAESTLEQIYTPAEMDSYIQDSIRESLPMALSLLKNIVAGTTPASIALRAKYASYLLACGGYGPITKVTRLNQYLSRDDIEAIKQRANEADRG